MAYVVSRARYAPLGRGKPYTMFTLSQVGIEYQVTARTFISREPIRPKQNAIAALWDIAAVSIGGSMVEVVSATLILTPRAMKAKTLRWERTAMRHA